MGVGRPFPDGLTVSVAVRSAFSHGKSGSATISLVLSPTASSVAVDTKGEIGWRVFRGRPSEALRTDRTGLGLRDFGEETGSIELGPMIPAV